MVGSAVLIEYEGRKVVATAEHVLSDNAKDGITSLFFFDSNREARPLGGTFQVSSPKFDLAARILTPDEIAALSHLPFLSQNDIGRAVPPGSRFYASVVGFPSTESRRMDDGPVIDTRMTGTVAALPTSLTSSMRNLKRNGALAGMFATAGSRTL